MEGDINQGVTYYKKALYYNWHYADAMYNLGVAYGEMLKFDMVIKINFMVHVFLFQTYSFPRDMGVVEHVSCLLCDVSCMLASLNS